MRIARLVPIVFNLLLGATCHAGLPEQFESSPFLSIIAKGDVVIVTLLKDSRLMVKLPTDKGVSRGCKESEVFKLAPGSSMTLFERHFSDTITPQIQPKPGVNIEFTFDGRSSCRGLMTKTFFVVAKEDKKAVEQGTSSDGENPSN